MQTNLFDYHLPEHLIAHTPAARRDHSRLMVINRATGEVTHTEFANLPHFLPQGARLFRNNATVLRARLKAQRPSGGQVECLLLRPAKPEDLAFFANGEGAASTAQAAGKTVTSASGSTQSAEKKPSAPAGSAQAAPTTANTAQISRWDFICLLKPGKRLKPGETFTLEGHFSATVLDKHPDGENRVRFTPLRGQQSVVEIATLAGDLPLPPYIEQARIADAKAQADSSATRAKTAGKQPASALAPETQTASATGNGTASDTTGAQHTHNNPDNERYQTVYADPSRTVAAAAPTAGLHFTPELLARLAAQGVDAHDLTLHVGLDTFRPITAERIEEHQIHRELYEIPAQTRAALEPQAGRPRVAVGTTTLRSIEHYFRHRDAQGQPASTAEAARCTNNPHTPQANGQSAVAASSLASGTAPWIAEADIFIYPPAQFAGVEALITNFHLPKSTLLCLVSAFLTPGSTDGIARLKELYAEAIARNYRFFSYGDAMLIL